MAFRNAAPEVKTQMDNLINIRPLGQLKTREETEKYRDKVRAHAAVIFDAVGGGPQPEPTYEDWEWAIYNRNYLTDEHRFWVDLQRGRPNEIDIELV